MYLLYTKDRDGWVFWVHDFGWSDISEATLYLPEQRSWFVLEGDYLYVGEGGELAPLAPVILDLMEVLKEHEDTNLASDAGRLQLASWLASGLAKDSEHIEWYNEHANTHGYSLRLYRGNWVMKTVTSFEE